ncbi:MAG TPA: hypothetical protein VHN77_04205 [Phycisphaerales bacterium]|nr:hypothetical protein [Phycisphaerales bacterium]
MALLGAQPLDVAWPRGGVDGLARTLGALRIAVCLSWLLLVSPDVCAVFAEFPDALRFPPGIWDDVHVRVPVTPGIVWGAYACFVPAAVVALLGVGPRSARAAMVVMLLTGGFLLSVPQFFGKVVHYHHVVWALVLVMTSPRAGVGAVSIWALRGCAQTEARGSEAPAWRSRLPVLTLGVLLGVSYFFAGFWKVCSVGWEWTDPENLRNILLAKWWETGHAPAAWLRPQSPAVLRAGGVATIVFEMSFLPLVLLGGWWRRGALLAGLVFHAGVQLTMEISFWHMAACYVALVDWGGGERAAAWAGVPRRASVWWSGVVAGVCGFLVVVQAYDGAARRQDWPFGLYPTFAVRVGPTVDTLTLRVDVPYQGVRELTSQDMGAHIGTSRARGLYLRVMHGGEAERDALWEAWQGLRPEVRGASVEFVRAAVTLDGVAGVE